MGNLVASFNPFDPSDPTYQTETDDLRDQAYNTNEKMAGSNFYPSDSGLPPITGAMPTDKPISGPEIEFEEHLS